MSELPAASEWATLLGGRVPLTIARDLCALKGVYYLPDRGILLVTPPGLLRMMSRGAGRAFWSHGGVELDVDGHTIELSPAQNWHPDL